MGRYEVHFNAENPDVLEADDAARLTGVIESLPGVALAEQAFPDQGHRLLQGRFTIDVEQAMADAARDGSRLAKEALALAGLPDARLVELNVRLLDGD